MSLHNETKRTIIVDTVKHFLFWITDLQCGYFFHNDRQTVIARAQQLEDTRGLEGLIFKVFDLDRPIYSSELPQLLSCWAGGRFTLHMNLTYDPIADSAATKQIMDAGCSFPLPHNPIPWPLSPEVAISKPKPDDVDPRHWPPCPQCSSREYGMYSDGTTLNFCVYCRIWFTVEGNFVRNETQEEYQKLCGPKVSALERFTQLMTENALYRGLSSAKTQEMLVKLAKQQKELQRLEFDLGEQKRRADTLERRCEEIRKILNVEYDTSWKEVTDCVESLRKFFYESVEISRQEQDRILHGDGTIAERGDKIESELTGEKPFKDGAQ